MKKFFFIVFTIFIAILFFSSAINKTPVFAQTYKGIEYRQLERTGCLYKNNDPDQVNNDKVKKLNEEAGFVLTIDCIPIMFFNLIFWALSFAGLVALVLVIAGGFKYMISGGDQKAVEGGKKTITWALVGLVVILLSFAIVGFVANVTGMRCLTRFGFIGTCGGDNPGGLPEDDGDSEDPTPTPTTPP